MNGLLTKLELHKINRRISEIEKILLDDNCPDDVAESLEYELDGMIEILEVSMRLARIRESGFKLIS